MQRSLFWQKHDPWAVGLTFLVWVVLGGLVSAQNIPPSGLPSGLPDDLSDMSPFMPCLGNLCGERPPYCPLYVEADAIWLRRDRIDPVSLQTLGVSGDVVLSTDALTEPYRPGTRVTVGHSYKDTCWQVDATYFYIDTWDDTAAVRDATPIIPNIGVTGYMFSPFTNFGHPPVIGLDYNDFVNIREFSEFQSVELNFRYSVPMPHDCLTAKLILGFRYIMVDEQFDYFTHSNVPVVVPPTGSAVYLDTLTKNDLFGPQIGGEFYFFIYPCCWIDVGIKGVLCDNRAVQHTTGTISDPGIDVDQYRERDATAFVGDLDVELVWKWNRHTMLKMGYQAIWVNNLALATRNFNPSADILLNNGPPQIDTIGRAVYHGPHIGLEFDW